MFSGVSTLVISNLLYFVITLSILVTVHEYGHFFVARCCGVKVLTFSIGFGRPLWQHTDSSGTQYRIAAIPLGGFVKMLDEREAPVADALLNQAFNRKPWWAKAAIVAAGPIANFLLAVLVYWAVFATGVSGIKPIIGDLDSATLASEAGFRSGDEIVAVDGSATASRIQVHMALAKRIGDSGNILFNLQSPNTLIETTHSIVVTRWLQGDEQPNFYQALGFTYWRPALPARIAQVVEGQPAAVAGIKAGDLITVINGEAITDWYHAVELLRNKSGERISLELDRAGLIVETSLEVAGFNLENGNRIGRIGVIANQPELPASMMIEQRWSIMPALYRATDETVDMIGFTLLSIKKMLMGLVSTSNLSGPVTIAKIASAAAESGITAYLQFLALLSVSLGVLNLLPIPILDGGHLIIIAVEALIGQPISERIIVWIQQVGLLLILSLMSVALYNDITHL